MAEVSNGVPSLPCPQCGVNLLEKGFYNYCSERSVVTERNYAYVAQDHIHVDHEETDNQIEDHECQLDAYCCECDDLLPWPLYELRNIGGRSPDEVGKAVAMLLAQLKSEDEGQQEGASA